MSKPPPGNQPFRAPDLATMQRFVENQAQELVVRQTEAENKKQETANAHEYNLKALDAQKQILSVQSYQQGTAARYGFIIVLALIAAITTIAIYAFHAGKEVALIDLAKYILAFLSGGATGYSVKAVKARKDNPG